jgi:predicted nucleic acid-binding protein
MIHLDTNFLIGALSPNSSEELHLLGWQLTGEPIGISAIVWAEFLCGPVSADQIRLASRLLPRPEPFLPQDAPLAADWFNRTGGGAAASPTA